eukprot:CAMPEP_0194141666 /NCGR_PEP_ID=MMETSP0152-20130528/11065_1 /TAXON_ID=1049557 /ORGANISM="Thalassiothrix antarctica, Strain L6-D1" /LENGTH=292 /DNA_ID=CAMNT_0038840367 /DNA_START=77 /DNA_END=955 /DNA_ORIENTATION=+
MLSTAASFTTPMKIMLPIFSETGLIVASASAYASPSEAVIALSEWANSHGALGLGAFAAPSEAVIALSEWTSSHGALGLGAFAAAHIFGVIICFPATILFEIAAGFLFGMVQGSILAWAAKVVAAMITFFVSSGIARKVLSDVGLEEKASAAFRSQPSLQRLAQNVEQEGARYTFLARLSPIPSWLNNYGLAFAGVRFVDYAPATAIATLPPVLTHVYAGSLLSSLQTLISGGSGNAGMNVPSTLAGSSLGGLSAVMGCLLLQELGKVVLTGEETPDVDNLKVFNEENDDAE